MSPDSYLPSSDTEAHCFIHKAREKRGIFQCDECFHQFAGEAELIRDFNMASDLADATLIEHGLIKEDERMPAATKVDQVLYCPWCSKDF